MSITINIFESADENGRKAAEKIAALIRGAIAARGKARIVLSTGQSQFEMFSYLVNEYVDLPITHAASFRRYLTERFVSKVPLKAHYFVEDEESIEKLTIKLREDKIDVGVIGIGENGHIAFNDPPADFDTDAAYKVVKLDDVCRAQQVGEGWFKSIDEVPEKAITMTPKEIMKAEHIVTVVPHSVKAKAIFDTITKTVSPYVPATLLKTHSDWNLFIDDDAAKLLLGK